MRCLCAHCKAKAAPQLYGLEEWAEDHAKGITTPDGEDAASVRESERIVRTAVLVCVDGTPEGRQVGLEHGIRRV